MRPRSEAASPLPGLVDEDALDGLDDMQQLALLNQMMVDAAAGNVALEQQLMQLQQQQLQQQGAQQGQQGAEEQQGQQQQQQQQQQQDLEAQVDAVEQGPPAVAPPPEVAAGAL